MSTGQTLITLGALILLSLAIFNVNKTLTYCDVSLAQNRYRLEALSLLTSYIEQAVQFSLMRRQLIQVVKKDFRTLHYRTLLDLMQMIME